MKTSWFKTMAAAAIAAFTFGFAPSAQADTVSYRYPVYNTEGEPTSGIKEWKDGEADATVVTSSMTQWGTSGATTWYVVAADVTISSRITCLGDVRLILADGQTLNASAGITASPNTSGYLGFTVYAQSEGATMGALVAKGANDAAGIGGLDGKDGAYITFNGGTVTATGAYDDAGIGGAYSGSGYNIQINGGLVSATGVRGAPGIGGGSNGDSSNIYVQDTLKVRADDETPPTAVVSHTSATDLSAVSEFNKTYVVTKPKGVEYGITVDATMQHGTVTAPAVAESGDTVSLTVVPDEGYAPDTITVTNALGEAVETTRVTSRKYTFEMPAYAVFVSATFAEIEPVSVSTYQELKDALLNEAEIINLTADIVAEDTLQCDYALTINGNGHVLSVPVTGADEIGVLNGDASRFQLLVSTDNLTITDLTLRGGAYTCLYNDGGSLKVLRCTIERSGGFEMGGGGLFNSGKCYLCDTKLSRNNADWGGGFLNVEGGVMVMERCSVNENRSLSDSGGGGAGEVDGGAYLIVNNCTFANNTSTEIGGAINLCGGDVYALNSTFVGNISSAADYGVETGGAIGINDGKFYAANTILVNNYSGYGSSISDYPDCDIGLFMSSDVAGAYGCAYGTVLAEYGEVEPETMSTSKHIPTTGVFSGYVQSPVLNPDGTRGAVLFNRPCISICLNGTYIAPIIPGSSAATGGIPTYFSVPDDVSSFSLSTIMAGYGETPTKLGDLALAGMDDLVTTYQDGTERVPGDIGPCGVSTISFATLTVAKSENGTVTGDGSIYGNTYPAGTTVGVAAIPNAGYYFAGWCVNGESTPSVRETRYTFVLTEDITLRAVFTEKPFTGQIDATPTGVDHTIPTVFTNDVESVETEEGVWVAEAYEYATVVYACEEGYAFPDGTMVKTNELDTTVDPAVNLGGKYPETPLPATDLGDGFKALDHGEGTYEILGEGELTNTTALVGKPITNLVINAGVTAIGDFAFEGFGSIRSVSVSESCIAIGKGAFHKCYAVSNMTFAADAITVGDYAFFRCLSLENLTFTGTPTYGENPYAVYTYLGKSGELRTIPEVIAPGYEAVVFGKRELTDPDWEEVGPIGFSITDTDYHFFQVRIRATDAE